MKTNIVICGLPREREMLMASLANFAKLKNELLVDRVIFSTWKGELSESFKLALDSLGVVVIEGDCPADRGHSNIWVQMKSLENGLNVCDKHSFVLKTRADIYIEHDFLRDIIGNAESYLHKDQNDNIFKYRIWVPWIEIRKPFYMADEIYYGYHDDVIKTVNYNGLYDMLNGKIGGGETHIRRFIEPFNNTTGYWTNYILDLDAVNKNPIKYKHYHKSFFNLIDKYFRIRLLSGVIKGRQPYWEPRVELNRDDFTTALNQTTMKGRVFCYNDQWVKTILEKL